LEKSIAARNAAPGGSPNAQLESLKSEVKTLRERREDLDRDIARFQARGEGAPRVEQDIVTLTRDFNKLNENYLPLLNKKLDAQLASKLEQRCQGDAFATLDP